MNIIAFLVRVIVLGLFSISTFADSITAGNASTVATNSAVTSSSVTNSPLANNSFINSGTFTNNRMARGSEPKSAQQGVIDLTHWRIDLKPTIELSGEWLFYEDQLLSLEDLSEQPIPGNRTFPTPLLKCASPFTLHESLESGAIDHTVESQEGQVSLSNLRTALLHKGCVATYVLELRQVPTQPLAIMIPELSTAFELAWNGQVVATGGVVSGLSRFYKPYVGHRIATLPISEGRAVLTLQVANWMGADSVSRNLILGDASVLQVQYAQGELLEALSAAIAGIGGLLLMIQQKARRRYEKGLWGLAVFSFAVLIYTVTEGFTVLGWLINEPSWAGVVRVNMISQNMFVPSIVIWLGSTYSGMFPRWFSKLMYVQLMICIPVLLLMPMGWLIALESAQMLMNLGAGLTGFLFLLLYRYQQTAHKMCGLIVTLIFVLVSAIHDVLLYQQLIYGMDWLPMGFVCFIVGQIFLLAVQRAQHHADLELINQKLSTTQMQLESKAETCTNALKEKIEELESVRAELRYLSRNDGLTGLLREQSFMTECGWILSEHQALDESVSVILLDIDRYKHISAMFGPIAADQAMKDVARLLEKWAEDERWCCRLEGESFAIFLPMMDEYEAIREAEWLRLRISQRSVLVENLSDTGQQFHITASFGVSTFLWSDADIGNMMNAAESALNQAKLQGRNCVVSYNSLQVLDDGSREQS